MKESLPDSCLRSCQARGYEWDGNIEHIRTPPWTDTKNLQVGDLITGYYKGYWRIISITERPDPYIAENLVGIDGNKVTCQISTYYQAPIIKAEKVLNVDGTKARKLIKDFDWVYAAKVHVESIEDAFKTLQQNLLTELHIKD